MEKITREELRKMAIGETKTFTLPNAQACDNGKSIAYQFQNLIGCNSVFQLTT